MIGGGVTIETAYYTMLWNGTEPNGSTGHPLVQWDFTSWHWYETSGDPALAYDGTSRPFNVLANLDQYGVPLWFTELGFNTADSATQEASYVTNALTSFLSRGPVSSYNIMNTCWYGLYDDANGDFGLVQSDGVTRKPAYTAYKNFVAAHPV
jgi:hypothetical protein